MKNILLIILLLFTSSCYNANYNIGDEICYLGKKVTIVSINTFIGAGARSKGVNYKCRYTTDIGEIKEITIYEKDFIDCIK